MSSAPARGATPDPPTTGRPHSGGGKAQRPKRRKTEEAARSAPAQTSSAAADAKGSEQTSESKPGRRSGRHSRQVVLGPLRFGRPPR